MLHGLQWKRQVVGSLLDIVHVLLGKECYRDYNVIVIIINTVIFRCGEVCSHVAAILFKVERLEITKETCTSLPCTWNQVYSTKVIIKIVDYIVMMLCFD